MNLWTVAAITVIGCAALVIAGMTHPLLFAVAVWPVCKGMDWLLSR